MKSLALIVDDNAELLELLKDNVESMGHDWRTAGSQSEALALLQSHTFAYVLLDLELPVRAGRPPSQNVGKNLLGQIKEDARNRHTPVLVITAHGSDTPALAVELMKGGAEDFLNKPFHDLEKRIKEALRNKQQHQVQRGAVAPSMASLTHAELKFTAEGLELDGILVCNSAARACRIVKALAQKRGSKRPSLSGKALADELREDRGEAAIAEAISAFRKQAAKRLAEANIHIPEDAIVMTTSSGYSLNPGIRVNVPSGSAAGDDPVRLSQTQRRQWLLAQLQEGKHIRRHDYQKRFEVSEPTAKRDLAGLKGQVKFVGAGVSGYYSLAQNVGSPPASIANR